MADLVLDSGHHFNWGNDECHYVDSEWFLNEERLHLGHLDEAHDVLEQKIDSKKLQLNSLTEEIYETEQAIKHIKQHNNKITESIVDNCMLCASSKALTNDPAVLDLRKNGLSIANKYVFVLENNDIVAIGNREIDVLKLCDNELIAYGNKSAEQLKEILEGTY